MDVYCLQSMFDADEGNGGVSGKCIVPLAGRRDQNLGKRTVR